MGLAARGRGAGSVLDNGSATVGFAVAVGVIDVVGRAIACKAIDASVEDTVDDTVDGIVDGVRACLRFGGLGVAVKSNLHINLLKQANLASIC